MNTEPLNCLDAWRKRGTHVEEAQGRLMHSLSKWYITNAERIEQQAQARSEQEEPEEAAVAELALLLAYRDWNVRSGAQEWIEMDDLAKG